MMGKPHFEVHPSVVYQLGESLVSDAVQALIELVKNCYDADATYAKVIIDTKGIVNVEESIYPSAVGKIIIEDDGFGMGLDDVETGWLTISNRKKQEIKLAKKTTPGGRTPLGDKGLGRLGVQRLGENLEIFTKSKNESGFHFGFSWIDFQTAPKLENVDIHLSEIQYSRKHGTKVVVSGLKEPEVWHSQLKRLEQELSRMISPYKQIRDFSLIVEVDGKALELVEISNRVRDIAPVRYSLSFDGEKITIQGRAKLDFFRSSSRKDAEEFSLLAESDNGQAFFDFLSSQITAQTIKLTQSRSKNWFIEFKWEKKLTDLDQVQRTLDNNSVANPGSFTGEIDAFDLGATAYQNQTVFNNINEYRNHVKDLSGIRVYRDGFAIRVDHDWLKLGAQWTSAGSYYGLKPDTTLGYIALSARDNMQLEETTDREGFKDSPYYRNFYLLLGEFKNLTTIAHDFFGRSWSNFRKMRNEIRAQVDSRKTVEDISATIKNGLTEVPQHQKNLLALKVRLDASVSESKTVISRLKSTKDVSSELRQKVTDVLSDLEPLLTEAREVIDRLSNYLNKLETLQGIGQVLEDRVDGLRQQMDDMYEAVALGLTAEALSHEVYNVADQLAQRAKTTQLTLRKKEINDRTITAFIEYVQSSVLSLRKQMSFLSPSLRYVREKKDDIDIYQFVKELVDFYSERLEKNKIEMDILNYDKSPFVVQINRGKLTQVIDNLVLNSEYWLKEDITQKRLKSGKVFVEISQPFIRVYDNGSGVDPNIEYAIFEPFVTAKAKGQGRGLGLFIVKQLLDSEGCNISLISKRNHRQRLFKFQIDLRGVLYE
jgi:signal transduction histidine kinase